MCHVGIAESDTKGYVLWGSLRVTERNVSVFTLHSSMHCAGVSASQASHVCGHPHAQHIFVSCSGTRWHLFGERPTGVSHLNLCCPLISHEL